MITIPTVNMVKTGQNINRLIRNAGLSVKDLQMMMGFSTPQAIYKWLHGTSMPTVDNLVALAAIFGVSIDEIICTEEATLLFAV
ncbi:MAG: helix-turn-helix transcriptional regulator [Lachnospiraceae bacterium]|nr:helix-turn-helix transcriptional regulator [Lachnospiraceae bacterium]